ncbi:pilus assembly FimT family protein [Prosthecobacter fusiformis]|uniref:pilus assembly FimT family protein n=1 Tax=Prosthecobacter fusiformis TaxID=48464 RepID=UPI0014152EAE|nr:prepilin-type N-terminal cleavage/methylation domain-containing protein [Prosthecobacter fusiformis]
MPCLVRHSSFNRGFTLVEIVISLTIIIVIAAGAVPMFKGLREEQQAREPIIELARLAKEARIRAMREKRPYQVAFYPGGFVASRYFSPYLQLAELTTFLQQGESGVYRLNPNADDNDADLDAGAGETSKTDLPLAPAGPKLDDNWEEHYSLAPDVQYRLKFWQDLEETFVEGEMVKLWVFQPSGICQPLKLHLEQPSAVFDVEFGALTADIIREAIDLR